jgi:hypothetical protein
MTDTIDVMTAFGPAERGDLAQSPGHSGQAARPNWAGDRQRPKSRNDSGRTRATTRVELA